MKRLLIIPFLFLASFVFAQNNDETILQNARNSDVDKIVRKEAYIYSQVERYIMLTADIAPTRAKITSEFNGVNWINYQNDNCNLSGSVCADNLSGGISLAFDTTNKKIVLSNIMGLTSKLSEVEKYRFKNSPDKGDGITVNDDETSSTIYFSAIIEHIVKTVNDVNNGNFAVISLAEPADKTKLWYKPDGLGGFDVFKYNPDTNQWDNLGKSSSTSNGKQICIGEGSGISPISSYAILEQIKAIDGTCAKVIEDDNIMTRRYVASLDKWLLEGSGGNELFNGEATIIEMANSLITKSGGSTVTSSSINGEYGGAKEFIKKDSTQNNGFWVDGTNMFIVSDSLDGLSTQNWLVNSIGYYKKTTGSIFVLKKLDLAGLRWVYLADNLGSVVTDFENIDLSSGGYVLNQEDSKYYRRIGNVWHSLDGEVQATNDSNGRNTFTSFSLNTTYYVNFNDCTVSSCNGDSSNGYYAGSQSYNMYTFYYSNVGNRKNSLIDAIPRTSLGDIYINNDEVSLFNNNLYFKEVDTRNNTCYKRSDGLFITRGEKIIPNAFIVGDKPNLSQHKTCSDASWNGDYLVLTRKQTAEWGDAPHGVGVNVSGVNFVHLLGSGKDFWTNNSSGDGQQSASEIFTGKGRASFPNVTHSLNALSLGLCSYDAFCPQINGVENRYTSGGVTSSIDSEFKQWRYSVAGTTVNSLLDSPLCNSSASCYALSTPIALHSSKGLIFKVGNYWKSGTSFLAKHYDNLWTTDSSIAEYAYYYEHSQYVKSDHRRVDNNQIWSEYISYSWTANDNTWFEGLRMWQLFTCRYDKCTISLTNCNLSSLTLGLNQSTGDMQQGCYKNYLINILTTGWH